MVDSIGARPVKYRRVQDHYRWLRSDGSPNFSNKIYEFRKELSLIASKPVVQIPSTLPIMKSIEEMSKGYRGLVVSRGGVLEGILLATQVINYLGGGGLFKIVEHKYNYNVFNALNREPVESIYERNVIVAYDRESIQEVLLKMVLHGIGYIPVVGEGNRVVGVVTEHDLVRVLASLYESGVKVSDIMSKPVITIPHNSTLSEAMSKMVGIGFRRLPVVEDNTVVGIITAMDIIRFYGTHEAFKYCTTGDIREINTVSVKQVMNEKPISIEPSADVSEAVRLMVDNNVSSILVVDREGVLQGIVTERDILYAIVTPR
ncbi:CBS domain-containing protein [Thermogladius sp. 4427co]|uniref:CBS domain-containing protein n=1 Tax=Thermogladius sp. 4427co TaxID=3450718 RepID=UPI003F7B1A20